MRMPDSSANQNAFLNLPLAHYNANARHAKEEDKFVHRKESDGSDIQPNNELDNYIGTLNSSGHPMPETSRMFFEPKCGHDFSNVRIHTGCGCGQIGAIHQCAGLYNRQQYRF